MTETKKLNAGIALVCLQLMDSQDGLTEDQVLQITALCERLLGTSLYKNDGVEQDQASIQHAIKLIEEYLEEEGV